MMRRTIFVPPILASFLMLMTACASAPPAPVAATISLERKLAWIFQLEDQRVLRVAPPPLAPAPVPARRGAPVAVPVAPVAPDLTTLVADPDARIRRRAALAIGRVGLSEGIAPLQATLADVDPDVRQMAAFALGLIGDKAASPALVAAMQDADPGVRGRAAQALGLIADAAARAAGDTAPPAADAAAAAAVGQMVGAYLRQGAIASLTPDDERWPGTPEADAVRLGLFALVPLKNYDALAGAVLDTSGRPVSAWWPIAYALQRIDDKRAILPLQQLAQGQGRYTRAFAARGLGALKDPSSARILLELLEGAREDPAVAVSAIRALAQIGAADAAAPLIAVLAAPKTDPNTRLETVAALGALKARDALPLVQDLLTDDWPALRAAALRAIAAIDPDGFLPVLSGMEPDRHWSVRATLADVLATLPGDATVERVRSMLDDEDKRAMPAVIRALARLRPPDIDAVLLTALKHAEFPVRAAAAQAIGQIKPAGGPAALRDAYRAALGDGTIDVRAAVLEALARYGAAEATETLRGALADKDWALRLKAADLLKHVDPSAEVVQAIRPVPSAPIAPYDTPDLLVPALSPHAFIETAKGTIEIELAVLDAPQTVKNFIALARKGFFNGAQIHRVVPNFVVQDGDPRGDGEGGPGYTIRDELNDRPYLRGVVGLALSGRDTGGSQFFITHSPQPHLDAKYTVFGRVVNGIDVVDRIQQWDAIDRIRIWDGKTMQ